MHKRKDDSQLIWESLRSRTNHKQDSMVNQLWEQDVKYVEQFLIDEGLMDKVKGAYKGAKEFASSKLLQPVMNFLAKIIANDPQMAEKAKAAAQKGPDALHQLASAEGDQSVMQQMEQQPVQAAESYLSKLKMNEFICEALVDDGIINVNESSIIQERYISGTVHALVNEHTHTQGIPWRPITEAGGQDFVAQLNSLLKSTNTNPGKAISAMLADDGPVGTQLYNFLRKVGADPDVVDKKIAQIQRTQQPASPEAPEQPASPEAPEQPASPEAPEQPASPEAEGQPASPEVPGQPAGIQDPNAPAAAATGGGDQQQPPTGPNPNSIQSTGLLSKIWSFIKSNKGAISGAAALGIAAALTASGNPMAASYLTGALIGGVRGAIKGATGTEGGFVDKLKGAANQAGKDSMIGGGIAAAGAGVGGAVAGLGGAEAAQGLAGGAEVPGAEPTIGGDELSDPTRPDAAELAQMQSDTTGPEVNANANLPDPYNPANSEAPPANPEVNANANLPDPYNPANSEAPMSEPTRPDEVRGIGADGEEYTRAEGEPAPGTEKKGFGQKFKDFFKPAQTQPGDPTTFQKMRMRR